MQADNIPLVVVVYKDDSVPKPATVSPDNETGTPPTMGTGGTDIPSLLAWPASKKQRVGPSVDTALFAPVPVNMDHLDVAKEYVTAHFSPHQVKCLDFKHQISSGVGIKFHSVPGWLIAWQDAYWTVLLGIGDEHVKAFYQVPTRNAMDLPIRPWRMPLHVPDDIENSLAQHLSQALQDKFLQRGDVVLVQTVSGGEYVRAAWGLPDTARHAVVLDGQLLLLLLHPKKAPLSKAVDCFWNGVKERVGYIGVSATYAGAAGLGMGMYDDHDLLSEDDLREQAAKIGAVEEAMLCGRRGTSLKSHYRKMFPSHCVPK